MDITYAPLPLQYYNTKILGIYEVYQAIIDNLFTSKKFGRFLGGEDGTVRGLWW